MSYMIVNFLGGEEPHAGLVVNDVCYDIALETGERKFASTMQVLHDWQRARPMLEALAARIEREDSISTGAPLAEMQLLAPLLYPGAVYCAGANYYDHVREMERAQNLPEGPTLKEQGEHPFHLVKGSRSIVRGPGVEIPLPGFSKAVDWEIELAAVIGRTASNVSVDDALDYVAGYTIANDLSARDAMAREAVPPGNPFRFDWLPHKSFDGSCPIGPWIAPASDIGDPQDLGLKLWVDGQLKQDSNTSQMIFTVAEQVASISSRVTLHPGDLILTGTPAGVGAPRRDFLKPGQTVKLWIEKIGELENRLV